MAVVAGLVIGTLGAVRGWTLRTCLSLPLLLAIVEVVVNTRLFGVAAMVVWTPILLALTVGATAGARAGTRALRFRRARASSQ
jgi:hypothetical protein